MTDNRLMANQKGQDLLDSILSEIDAAPKVEQAPSEPKTPKVEAAPTPQVEAKAETKVESKVEPESKEPVQALSKRAVDLDRREAELRKLESQLKADREALARAVPTDRIKELAKTDVWEALEALGINPEEAIQPLATRALSDRTPGAKEARTAAKAAKEELDAIKRARQDLENEKTQLQVKKLMDETRTEIKGKAAATDDYELLRLRPDMHDQVIEVMLRHYESTQQQMSIDEAMQLTEKFLEDQLRPTASAKKLAPKAPVPDQTKSDPAIKQPLPTERVAKTLTNDQQGSAPPAGPRAITEHDRERQLEQLARDWRSLS